MELATSLSKVRGQTLFFLLLQRQVKVSGFGAVDDGGIQVTIYGMAGGGWLLKGFGEKCRYIYLYVHIFVGRAEIARDVRDGGAFYL